MEFNTYQEAKVKEIELISLYGRRDLGKGTLVNFTDGGEGTQGKVSWCKGLKGIHSQTTIVNSGG